MKKVILGALAGLAALVGFGVLAFVIGGLLALPVMWLWNNCLVGAIAGVSDIGFWQAWGLLILSGLLFKNSSASTNSKS